MNDDPIKVFGQVVREARKQRSMSQEELAFESDLDRTFISHVETGRKQPSLSTIISLAHALNETPSVLLRRVEERLRRDSL